MVLFLAKYDSVLSQHVTQCIEDSKCRKDSHPTIKGRGNLITFLSKTTVNKLVKICGNRVKLAISNHVKEAKKFSIEVDSCQDVGVVDQVAICVRYVRNGLVNERLISMISIHNTSGRQYFEIIKKVFFDFGINMKTVISSAFDGASNMSGKYNGLQAVLKEIAPDMIYTHCYAHVLNLVMVAPCLSCLKAHILFGLLEKAAVFIQDYDDEESIEDTVDKDIKACLDLATSIPDFTNVDWLQKDLNEEGFKRLSDSDIAVRYGSVTTPSTSQQPDSSSESDNEEHFEKIQTSQAMEAVDVLLNFCEQENFDFHDVIGLRKIRSEVRKIISNQKKQRLIISYFKP